MPPSPRVWAGDWVLVRKVSDEVEDEGLGLWGHQANLVGVQN